MGCDIHMFLEKPIESRLAKELNEPQWEFVCELEIGRNYNLFGVLAGVRHETKPIKPVAGFPKDLTSTIKELEEQWGPDWHSKTFYVIRELKTSQWEANKALNDFPHFQGLVLALPQDFRLIIAFDN